MKKQVKSVYRVYFAECSRYVKMSSILSEIGIHKSTFSRFMQSEAYDHYLSVDKLETIKREVAERLKNFT